METRLRIEQIAAFQGYYTKRGAAFGPTGKLTPGTGSSGYPHIRFWSKADQKYRCCLCHRLTAFQKFGVSMYESGIQVRHMDANRQNFREENIEIGTASQNTRDMPGKVRSERVSKAHKKRYSSLWGKLDAALQAGMTTKAAAEFAGCNERTVRKHKNRKEK